MKHWSEWLKTIEEYDTKSHALIKSNLFDNINLIISSEEIPEGEILMEIQNIIYAFEIYCER